MRCSSAGSTATTSASSWCPSSASSSPRRSAAPADPPLPWPNTPPKVPFPSLFFFSFFFVPRRVRFCVESGASKGAPDGVDEGTETAQHRTMEPGGQGFQRFASPVGDRGGSTCPPPGFLVDLTVSGQQSDTHTHNPNQSPQAEGLDQTWPAHR